MTDGMGNTLAAGHYLYWKDKAMVVRVVDVIEPKLAGNTSPPAIVLQIVLPIMGTQPGKPITLTDFLRVVDPEAEKLVAAITEGGGGRPQ